MMFAEFEAGGPKNTKLGPGRLDRRHFLTLASAWALFLGAHGWSAGGEEKKAEPPPSEPRIQSLRLRTSSPLKEMREFYADKIGFSVLRETPQEITFHTGGSRLTFVAMEPGAGAPFYHFAFNIPENKLRGAREWQLQRTDLLLPPPRLQDPSMPKDVIHFRHWNAHSVFFWDPAGNLVEYIARHDLENRQAGPFELSDILYTSEIGLITEDVSAMAGVLQDQLGLTPYRQGSDQFQAMGDENGLLLVIGKGRVWGWGSERGQAANIFPTEVSITGAGKELRPEGLPYSIRRGGG